MPSRTRDGQLALFNVGRVPNLLTRDLRTVGELLADTDFQSRQLLFDLVVEDAPHLIVGWPRVLYAARDLWQELPPPQTPVAAAQCERAMELLTARGNGYLTDLGKARAYLGEVEPDARLTQIADTFARATALVHKFAQDIDVSHEPAKRDVAAARIRVLHTLYLTIHAVHASTQLLRREVAIGRIRPSALLPTLRGYRQARVVEIFETWTHRFGSTEAAIGRALNGDYPRVIDDEIVPPPDGVVRLPRALATWEIATHRLLAANPSNADIALIARTEGLIVVAGRHVIGADPRRDDTEVVTACSAAAANWAKVARWWQTLTPAARAPHPQLLNAAAEVRASTRAFTVERTHIADAGTIVEHPGRGAAIQALKVALEDTRDVARIVSSYSRDSQLCGPARAVSRAAQDLAEAGGATDDVVWVSPADTMSNKMVALPRPVAEKLHADAAELEFTTRLLAAAATQHTSSRPSNEANALGNPSPPALSQHYDDRPDPDEGMPLAAF